MKGKEKGNTGKRYTEAQKKRVLDFIYSQGRGGIAAAQKKFGVSYIAVRRWMTNTTSPHGLTAKGRRFAPAQASMPMKEFEAFKKAFKKFAEKL